ncbi:hypothetical protein AVEN_13777-1 [Araneus ventricosus]|uniref:Uncharacterized protein n=1 Tax=Araneus ventricosus TaxID=182803 RepID=A0A4Y2SP65_ARAVE|nr:hypothetical protein AVEN_13777-1 [Araneus ventricosus]
MAEARTSCATDSQELQARLELISPPPTPHSKCSYTNNHSWEKFLNEILDYSSSTAATSGEDSVLYIDPEGKKPRGVISGDCRDHGVDPPLPNHRL